MNFLPDQKNHGETRVPPYVLLSFAASSGIGFYADRDGLKRLDIVTGKNELQESGVEQFAKGLEFDLMATRLAFESHDELASFIETEYLRDKKNIYYTLLFTNKQLNDAARLSILKFLNDPGLRRVKMSPALLPTLLEIADYPLAQAAQKLAAKSSLANVIECFSTELRDVFQKPMEATASGSPDVVGYYVKFVESVKRRMSTHVPERRTEPEETPVAQLPVIGTSMVIKGEVTGAESLYIDGRVEGSINMAGGRVTISRNAIVSANISAREIVVLGKVRGNLSATDRVDIRCDGWLTGDVMAARISIEDGAYFKGGIDIRKSGAPASLNAQNQVEEPAVEAVSSFRRP